MTKGLTLVIALLAGCHAKPDLETRCHDIVEHMRKVSSMPMRDGDVMMLMGACKMWMQSTLACMEKAMNDDELASCRKLEGS